MPLKLNIYNRLTFLLQQEHKVWIEASGLNICGQEPKEQTALVHAIQSQSHNHTHRCTIQTIQDNGGSNNAMNMLQSMLLYYGTPGVVSSFQFKWIILVISDERKKLCLWDSDCTQLKSPALITSLEQKGNSMCTEGQLIVTDYFYQ